MLNKLINSPNMDPQAPVSMPTPTPIPPTQKEKPSTMTYILFVILGVLLLGGIGIGLYYLVFKPSDDTTTEGDTTDTAGGGDEEDDTGGGDGEEAAILEYTNAHYPDILITYDDTWTMDEEETAGPEAGSTNVTVTFTKENHSLIYYLDAVSVYGGVPWCTAIGVTEYTHLEGHWARVVTTEGYRYDGSSLIRGVTYGDGSDLDSTIAFSEGEEADPAAYDYCSVDAPIGTSTSMAIPEDDPEYAPGALYQGLVSISLEITGAEDADIVAEADEIVLGTEF